MIYLGIDPGSRNCGYGVLKVENGKIVAVSYDIIKLRGTDDISVRIVKIYDTICEVIKQVQPDKVAVETIFYGKNVRSAFTLGHVRGAILLAVAQHKLPVAEYSPREIKKGVTGNGNASKQQIQYMLPKLLGIATKRREDGTEELLPEDAADALAIAFCLFNHDRQNRTQGRGSGVTLKRNVSTKTMDEG